MDKIRKFGLIGYPLKHSFSPAYFAKKFEVEQIKDAKYDLYELERIEAFEGLSEKDLIGLNVTIPYKEQVIPYLDELSEEAQEIGAVNTIKFDHGKKIGFNTDCFGFENSLKELLGENVLDQAFILGTGGASKAVQYVLKKLAIAHTLISRKPEFLNYEELEMHHFEGKVLFINTTPLGTWPDVHKAPNIPYELITKNHFLYDLVYNPEETQFLAKGREMQATGKNGYDMLKLQAEKSWEIWNQ